jgi:hypothetical protein
VNKDENVSPVAGCGRLKTSAADSSIPSWGPYASLVTFEGHSVYLDLRSAGKLNFAGSDCNHCLRSGSGKKLGVYPP